MLEKEKEFLQQREEHLMEDGRHVIIKCINCGKDLADIWITKPDVKIESRISCLCPYCNEYTAAIKIDGQYCLGELENSSVAIVDTNVEEYEGECFCQHVTIETQLK
jgi:hypothetical protein